MAATYPNEPVMYCTENEFIEVNTLATRVINEGIYFNADIFTIPSVSLLVFKTANDELTHLISQVKDDSEIIKERNTQCTLVFGCLKKLLLYVKQLANGNIAIINKSGFDLNSHNTPVVKGVQRSRSL
jgi:hypothetical protein